MNDTKFKYGDHVIIKYGFHRDLAGKVQDRNEKISDIFIFKPTKIEILYKIKTDVGNLDIWVKEDQIQLITK